MPLMTTHHITPAAIDAQNNAPGGEVGISLLPTCVTNRTGVGGEAGPRRLQCKQHAAQWSQQRGPPGAWLSFTGSRVNSWGSSQTKVACCSHRAYESWFAQAESTSLPERAFEGG